MLERKIKKLFWTLAGGLVKRGPDSFRLGPSPSILLLRPDRLGDFLLSAPAIRALELMAGPSARITIVAGKRNEALARALFPKAKVMVFRNFFPSRILLFLRLWTCHYDATIDLHSYPFSTTSALMTLLSGSPLRVGFWAGGDHREYGTLSKKVYNRGLPTPPENLHESLKGFRLAKGLYPSIVFDVVHPLVPPVRPSTVQAVKRFYEGMDLSRKTKILGLHPTLQKVDNCWSKERYVQLIGKLGSNPDLKILLIHGKGEGDDLKRFQAFLGPLPNVFALPSDDLFFILEAAKRLDLLVCNDSGLMHLVAGVTSLLAVFGPSDPRRWGPLASQGYKTRIFRKSDHLCDSVQASEVAREALKTVKR